jgi:hypothetical protein
MLITWIMLAIGQLSSGSEPLINLSTAVSRPVPTPITPGEPSTLVEALIGVGVIAAYFVITRRTRVRRSLQRISKPTSAGSGRKAA